MIGINLEIEPGEVAYFSVAGRQYALACQVLPQVNDSGRSLISHGQSGRYQARQLSDRSDGLPAGIRLEQTKAYGVDDGWAVYDGEKMIGWASDEDYARERILEPYLAKLARCARTRDGLERARQRYS